MTRVMERVVKEEHMKNLVNRLEGIELGDLISLRGPQATEAVGFVREIKLDKVVLSQENPAHDHRLYSLSANIEESSGDRTYDLKFFEEYEILRKHPESLVY